MEHPPPWYTDNFRELAVERQEFEGFRMYPTWQGVTRGAFGRSEALHSGRCCTTFGTSVCRSSSMSFVFPVGNLVGNTVGNKQSETQLWVPIGRLDARCRGERCQSVLHGHMPQPGDKSEHCSSRSDHDLRNFLMHVSRLQTGQQHAHKQNNTVGRRWALCWSRNSCLCSIQG